MRKLYCAVMAVFGVTIIDMGCALGYPSGYPYRMVDSAGQYQNRCVRVIATGACYWCASDSVSATTANCVTGANCASVTNVQSGSKIPGTNVSCVVQFQDTNGCNDYAFWQAYPLNNNEVYTIYSGAMCETEFITNTRCLAGFYGDGTTCTRCPQSYITGSFDANGQIMPPPVSSSNAGSTDIDDCSVSLSASNTYADDTGTFSVTNSHNCSYGGNATVGPILPVSQ